MKNNSKDATYPILGKDLISVATCLFMLGTAFMLLNGLKIRITLNDFKFGTSGIKEMRPIMTTTKSRMFHPSLR